MKMKLWHQSLWVTLTLAFIKLKYNVLNFITFMFLKGPQHGNQRFSLCVKTVVFSNFNIQKQEFFIFHNSVPTPSKFHRFQSSFQHEECNFSFTHYFLLLPLSHNKMGVQEFENRPYLLNWSWHGTRKYMKAQLWNLNIDLHLCTFI